MDVMTAGVADNLFISSTTQSEQMQTLANQALSSGIAKYQDGDYESAADDFNRAFGLSFNGDYAYEAIQYASKAYQALGDTDKAIHVYEKALKINTTDDRFYLDMGNLLFGEGRYGESLEAFENAVRLFDDSTNRLSLGQAYLKLERYNEATFQFEKIVDMGGDHRRNGYYALGQTYRAQEEYGSAVDYFQRAFDMDNEFYEAYAEIGYTYADAGKIDEAEAIQAELEYMDEDTADMLDSYINQATTPRIMFAYADSTFPYYSGANTQLSVISDYLENSGDSKIVTMEFQFNKEMDRESVENILNWSITRSSESGMAMAYNFNRGVASTEVSLPQFPISVYYNEDAFAATIYFNLTQNDDADGTIDPEHIVFAFSGVDADGNEMDENFDQYMGFSGSF